MCRFRTSLICAEQLFEYMTLPNGYETRKCGATYKIYDKESGECVSLGYHTINYPNVKVGAHRTELIEYRGYFIPKSVPLWMKKRRKNRGFDRREHLRQENPKLLAAIEQYHKNYNSKLLKSDMSAYSDAEVHMIKNKIKKNTPELRNLNLDEQTESTVSEDKETKTQDINDYVDSYVSESDDKEISTLEPEDVHFSKNQLVILISGRLSGIITVESGEMSGMYTRIITGFPNIKEVLDEVDSVDDVQDIEDKLPFELTNQDYQRMKEAQALASSPTRIESQNQSKIMDFA